jgi:hypothetical protein
VQRKEAEVAEWTKRLTDYARGNLHAGHLAAI